MSYSNNTKSMKSFCRWHECTETADQEYDQGMIDEATTGEKKERQLTKMCLALLTLAKELKWILDRFAMKTVRKCGRSAII